MQAELHGVFDAGIDEGTPAARRRMLAWALREGGTWYDREVPHPSDPTGTPSTQQGVHLLPEPNGTDHYNPHDPQRPLKVLPPAPPGTPDELVLQPGDAPAPGQYVVHDTEDLDVPYLPDPLASGVSLAFTAAGSGRHVAFPWGAEQVTARYPGTWPEREPFLLTLGGADRLDASIDGRAIDVRLPAGDVQTFRLASTVPEARLPWLGVWRSLADALTGDPDVREAAADGLLWSLTPGEEVRLVHAVPRPVLAPRPTVVTAIRGPGSVLAALVGGVEVHGPSTDTVTTALAWTDLVDDVTLDGPVSRSSHHGRLRGRRPAGGPHPPAVGGRPERAAAGVGGRGAAGHRALAAGHPPPRRALPVPGLDPVPRVLRARAARRRTRRTRSMTGRAS